MLFEVAFVRIEHCVERRQIEADDPEEAEEIANGMIENDEISFDGEVCHGEEAILEILECKEKPK